MRDLPNRFGIECATRTTSARRAVAGFHRRDDMDQAGMVAAGGKHLGDDVQLTAQNLLTEIDHRRLMQITEHRNKAAHPSGVYASAEATRP
jgi:hypothetical protein